MQAKFLYKVKEFNDVLIEGINTFEAPQSLLSYLNKELLMRPKERELWNYELNRIKYSSTTGNYLDRQETGTQELTMLTGLMIVAKFMIVKVFLNSHKYSRQLMGVQFS